MLKPGVRGSVRVSLSWSRLLSALALGLLCAWLLPASYVPAAAAERQRLCVIPSLALRPLYVPPPPSPAAAAEEADDDEDEDEAEEDDEETLKGFGRADGTCIAIGGGINAVTQVNRQRVPLGTIAAPTDLTTFSIAANLRLVTLSRLDDGTELRTTFGLLLDPANEATVGLASLTDAWIGFGGWKIGYASSNFNFWTGDEFFFGTRIPARSTFMAARTFQLTKSWSAGLGIEAYDPGQKVPLPTLVNPIPGLRLPDVVAKFAYSGDNLEFQLAGAWTERRPPDGGRARYGKAAMVGALYTTEVFGRPQLLMGQISVAHDAPTYLGTQSDTRIIRRLVDASDSTRGMSFQLSSTRRWTDTISTSTYVSMLRLDFPKFTATRGATAVFWSGAGNIVWSPVRNLRFAFEAGLSRAKMNLPNRVIPVDISGRQATAMIWMDRRF